MSDTSPLPTGPGPDRGRGRQTSITKMVFWLGLRLGSPFGPKLMEISFNGGDAGIEAGGSHKRKLEYPVSIDKPRYEFRQR